MADVFGMPVAGVYATDRLATAAGYPTTWAAVGPHGERRKGFAGSEVVAEDGTLPMRVILRCIGHSDYIMWKRSQANGRNRQFCLMPEGIFITHVFLVAHHPHTVHEGSQLAVRLIWTYQEWTPASTWNACFV